MSVKTKRNFWNILLLLCQPLIFFLMRMAGKEVFLETPLGYSAILAVDVFLMSLITVPVDWSHGRRIMQFVSIQCGIFAALTLALGWTYESKIQEIMSPLMLGLFGLLPIVVIWTKKD